jgi:hypothetical protein
MLTILVLLSSRAVEVALPFIALMKFAPEIRQIVYKFIFKRNTRFKLRFKAAEPPFKINYSKRISAILQTSRQVYSEARPVLYRENVFAVIGDRDCLAPFVPTPFGNKVGALLGVRDLTVHIVKRSNLTRSTWKYICMSELDILTLDFGEDGQYSIFGGPGIENPILEMAKVLCLTKSVPEAELRPLVINAKTVVCHRSDRTKELNSCQAFRRALSCTGTSNLYPKARKIVLKGGLTDRQLLDLPLEAIYSVPGWHLKEIQDEDKDTENKENEPEGKTFVWLKQEELSQ